MIGLAMKHRTQRPPTIDEIGWRVALRLASLMAACVISLTTEAAADPLKLGQRFQSELDTRVEAQLSGLLEAKLEAQAASLLARQSTGPNGLAKTKLGEVVRSGWLGPNGTPTAPSSTACSGPAPGSTGGPARPGSPASNPASWAVPVS